MMYLYFPFHQCDFKQKIRFQSFQKKYDAACTCILLVLDARGLENYSGPGYHHPNKPLEAPKDMECFPVMVSYPTVSIQTGETFWFSDLTLP